MQDSTDMGEESSSHRPNHHQAVNSNQSLPENLDDIPEADLIKYPSNQPVEIETGTETPDAQGVESSAKKKQPSADDWDGPDDPENPMNWHWLKKGYHVSMVAILAFAT